MTNISHDRLDQVEDVLLRVAIQQEANTAAIAQLIAEAESDRKMIWAMMEHMDEVHAENQQILNYLFNQQRGNGHGGEPHH